MRVITVLALLGILFCFAVPTQADPGSASLKVEWYTNPADTMRSYCVGDVKGVWCHVTQQWREWSFDRWQHWKGVALCPVTPPRCENEAEAERVRGLLRAGLVVMSEPIGPPSMPRLTGNQAPTRVESQYIRNGKPSTREELMDAMESRIPDTAKLRRITIIGNEAERKNALQIVGKPSWAVVRAFAPDDWYVADNGFVANGSPTVYVQEADGTVLHRQDDLSGLSVALERANPNYDPSRDPDLRKPTQPANPLPIAVPDWLGDIEWRSFGIGSIAAGVAMFLYSMWQKLKGGNNVPTK